LPAGMLRSRARWKAGQGEAPPVVAGSAGAEGTAAGSGTDSASESAAVGVSLSPVSVAAGRAGVAGTGGAAGVGLGGGVDVSAQANRTRASRRIGRQHVRADRHDPVVECCSGKGLGDASKIMTLQGGGMFLGG
jgi:hypothetical protein